MGDGRVIIETMRDQGMKVNSLLAFINPHGRAGLGYYKVTARIECDQGVT